MDIYRFQSHNRKINLHFFKVNEVISIDITLSAGNPVSYSLTSTSANGFNSEIGTNYSIKGFHSNNSYFMEDIFNIWNFVGSIGPANKVYTESYTTPDRYESKLNHKDYIHISSETNHFLILF